jgi:transposase
MGSPSFTPTWQPPATRPASSTKQPTAGARARADREAVRLRAAALFARGVPASSVAERLGVARQTAVSWQARWRTGGAVALRSRGPSQRPQVPDSQLPAIDKALRKGPAAHGFDTKVWTSEQVRVVIQQVTGVQLVPSVVKRLLRERLGWTVQQP